MVMTTQQRGGTAAEPESSPAPEKICFAELAALAREHGSPFYVFDRKAFIRNIGDLRSAFERRYPRALVGYSYKTNHIPYVCRLARELGAYAEVVSRTEVELALRLGCPAKEIIFNGPLKLEEDLELALSAGMMVNLDTFRELEQVIDFARRRGGPVAVGLRLNIALVDGEGRSHLQEGLPAGRFGFSPPDLEAAAQRLRQAPNVRVRSLHGHVSSTCRSPWAYRTIARTLADAAARLFPETIDTLNIGGGYFGRRSAAMGMVDTPTYDDYGEAVGDELRRHPWIEARRPLLVVEPGMAVVADTMSFVTRVFEVKTIGERRLAVVDGTFLQVRPTLHRRPLPFEVIRNVEAGAAGRFSVVGATCMEKDCLLIDVEGPEPGRGDFLRIGNVGAYTVVLTPPFIHPPPAVLVREGERWLPIRRRQSLDDLFASYHFPDAMEVP